MLIYENHISQIEEQINRIPPLSRLIINKKLNNRGTKVSRYGVRRL